MSGNLLNNDNKPNYLFKKENYKAQTRLDGFSNNLLSKTFKQEGYQGKVTVLQESIFSLDISKNIQSNLEISKLYNGPVLSLDSSVPIVNESTWNTNTGSTAADQTIQSYNLGVSNPDLSYYTFYKRVYLEPVEISNPSFWWIREDPNNLPSPNNNLLTKMIPGALNSLGDMFEPIVEFYDTSVGASGGWKNNEKAATFNPTSVNWSIDYATGILTLNVDESHLDSTNYTLDASISGSLIEKVRPRISFFRYTGPLGSGSGGGTGGGGTGGGGITDASYNELKDDIADVEEKLEEYLFNLPETVTDFSYNEVTDVAGIPHAILTWSNPLQKCSAFDFYQIDELGIGIRDQTYKPNNSNGISNNDTGIWDTIKRSMNKLPFHERIHLQYQQYDPNLNFSITSVDINNNPIWKDLGKAQVVGSNGILSATNNSGKTLYPIFKDITRADIFTDGTVSQPNLTNGFTYQDIQNASKPSYLSKSKKTYTNQNTLDSSKVYKFRIALDNKACIGGNSDNNADNNDRDISNNLNWATIPSSGYIELGSYGPAPSPSNIQFVTGEKAFDNSGNSPFTGSITGSAGPSSSSTGPVMDISFNTAFGPSAPLTVYYGFRIKGSQLSNSKQMGASKTSNLGLQYANENSFAYSDLSYNTPGYNISNSDGTKSATFIVDCDINNVNGWEPSTTSNFSTNFPHGIALPEHTYDISSVYMMNDKKDYLPGVKSFTNNSVYGGNFPSKSTFASPEQTSSAVFGVNNYMNPLENEVIDSSAISATPGFKITLNTPPTNYYSSSDQLKKVRTKNHDERYAIFLENNSTLDLGFNPGDFLSATSGDFTNVNFVTCPQKTATTVIVGEDISSNTIATYDMTFHYYNGNPVTDNTSVSIDGYDKSQSSFPYTSTNQNTNSNIVTTVSIQNDDPTETVPVSGRSRVQEQFGGYYNIQKVMSQTGITGITLNDIFDVAKQPTNKYKPYSFKLEQTLDLSGGTVRYKIIKFLLAEAPNFDITVPVSSTTKLEVPSNGILTGTKLFGVSMPSSALQFNINNFTVNNINEDWIWPEPENLFNLELIYRYNRTNTTQNVTLDTQEKDWNNSVTTQQTESWTISEVLNSPSSLVDTHKYSRKGVEDGTPGTNAQFEIKIRCKNNIYSIADPSFPQHFDVLYLSNDSTSWDWDISSTLPVNSILWWDYTYRSTSISNGDLPSNFITITNLRPGSKSVLATLQLQNTSVSANYNNPVGALPSTGSYYLLGGPTTQSTVVTTNHEWYDTEYDHSSLTTNDNQLLWSNESFKCGSVAPVGTLTKDTNILNPYIDYSSIYFVNTGNQPDHSGKLNVGENWDYTLKSGENLIFPPQQPQQVRYQGTYKWVLIKLSWDSSGTYDSTDNPWSGLNGDSQLEIYVYEKDSNGNINKLALGNDYLMWICAVGGGISSSLIQFKDNTQPTRVTRNRCGWLDCQRKAPTTKNYIDGEGCRDANAIQGVYKFGIPTITNNASANRVTDIFIRVGIPNNTTTLTSGNTFYDGKNINNISVKLNA